MPEGLLAPDLGDHRAYDVLSRPLQISNLVPGTSSGTPEGASPDPATQVSLSAYQPGGMAGSEQIGAWGAGQSIRRTLDERGRLNAVHLPSTAELTFDLGSWTPSYDGLDRPIKLKGAHLDDQGQTTAIPGVGLDLSWADPSSLTEAGANRNGRPPVRASTDRPLGLSMIFGPVSWLSSASERLSRAEAAPVR